MAENSSNGWKTLWEKEKLLVMSNFSFSQSVFYPGLLWERVSLLPNVQHFRLLQIESMCRRNIYIYIYDSKIEGCYEMSRKHFYLKKKKNFIHRLKDCFLKHCEKMKKKTHFAFFCNIFSLCMCYSPWICCLKLLSNRESTTFVVSAKS